MLQIKGRYTPVNLSALYNERIVCLTLDLEQDHADLLEEPSYEGLERIPKLVNFFTGKGIPLTCFVQGSLFETHWERISELLQLDIEFGLHSYSHPSPANMNFELEITRGREAFKNTFGSYPVAYRSPLGFIKQEGFQILAANGFKYDSSISPSFRPGVFNNLRIPTKPFLVNNSGIIEFPFAVFSSFIRIPIALSYIRLFGKPYSLLLHRTRLPSLIVFGFHLHDVFNLDSADKIPLGKHSILTKAIYSRIYEHKTEELELLEQIISMLGQKGYTFVKLRDVYDTIHGKDG